MDIWDYDRRTRVLLGRSAADPNPGEPGEWLIPAHATAIRPPLVPEGCVAIFNGGLSAVGEWRIELDAGQATGLGLPEYEALRVAINSYLESREGHDEARSAVMELAEVLLEQSGATDLSPADQKAVRDQARALIRTLLYCKSVN